MSRLASPPSSFPLCSPDDMNLLSILLPPHSHKNNSPFSINEVINKTSSSFPPPIFSYGVRGGGEENNKRKAGQASREGSKDRKHGSFCAALKLKRRSPSVTNKIHISMFG